MPAFLQSVKYAVALAIFSSVYFHDFFLLSKSFATTYRAPTSANSMHVTEARNLFSQIFQGKGMARYWERKKLSNTSLF